ncbi:MAG: GMP synthase subunit A [Thermoplasmata archaeon]
MKIYVVDNGGQWTHREWRVLKYLGVETQIVANTTATEKLADADGLLLSGGAPRIGSEMEKLGNVGEYLEKLQIPILGICVGHQYIALHFGGRAGPARVPAYGKVEITVENADELFDGLPRKFVVWESHNDEVQVVPEVLEILASSENCRVEAMKHRKRAIYGVQFHPEVEHTQHGEEIFRNFIKVCRK